MNVRAACDAALLMKENMNNTDRRLCRILETYIEVIEMNVNRRRTASGEANVAIPREAALSRLLVSFPHSRPSLQLELAIALASLLTLNIAVEGLGSVHPSLKWI